MGLYHSCGRLRVPAFGKFKALLVSFMFGFPCYVGLVAPASAVWKSQTLASPVSGMGNSIAIDSNNYPRLAYYESAAKHLIQYNKWTGISWSSQTIESDNTSSNQKISIAIDHADVSHIAYIAYSPSSGNLKYAKWTGASWSTQTLSGINDSNMGFSLAIDSSNYPQIVLGSTGGLKFYKWTGAAWSNQTVDSGYVGYYNSMVIDKLNHPHIAYYDVTNAKLKYAKWNGTSWEISTLDDCGQLGVAIAVDSNNYPHIAYHYADAVGNHSLKYTKWNGSSWSTQTIEGSLTCAYNVSIYIDASDYPHISYSKNGWQAVIYARWNGTVWATNEVPANGTAVSISMSHDSNYYPHIAFDSFSGASDYLTYNAWYPIAGKITENDDITPLTGAQVEVYSAGVFKASTTADSSGNYWINLPEGIYDVFVTSKGYIGKLTQSVTFNANNDTLNVSLPPALPGLIGYWKFDEGSGTRAFDYSGYAHHGIITNATWSSGKDGEALVFNGINSAVTVPSNIDLNLTDKVTLAAWIKYSSYNSGTIISKMSPGWSLDLNSSSQTQFTWGATLNHSQENILSPNVWNQVVATMDPESGSAIYRNGEKVFTGGAAVAPTNSSNLVIGSGGVGPWSGSIDEVMLFNRALSSSEVTNISGTLYNLSAGSSVTIHTDLLDLDILSLTFPVAVSIGINVPVVVPSAASGQLASGVAVQITPTPLVQPTKGVTITIHYTLTDIAGLEENSLVIARYDDSVGSWTPLPSTVDAVAKTVTAITNHFSIFQIMQITPTAGLAAIKVGPNPYKPLRNPGQSVTFRGLPSDGKVKIYTYLGELIREFSADSSGNAAWDGCNSGGKSVASGVYVALVQGAGKKKIFKIMVEK